MIESLHQIDFLMPGGASVRLLDIGSIVERDPVLDWQQRGEVYYPIGAEWAENQALGGATVQVGWTSCRNHASHADLHGFCIRHAASLPSGITGTLRVTISGGEVWEISSAVLSSSSPLPMVPSAAFETVTSYQVTGCEMLPVVAITLYAGIPWVFILQDWTALTGDWDAL